MTVWEDGQFIITSTFSAPGNWRLSLRIGSVIGLYNTASGLVLTAFQDEEMRERMMREHRLVPGENAMPLEEFRAEVKQIREAGYTCEPSRQTKLVTNISFPVLDPFGNAIAAVTCPFAERVDDGPEPDLEAVIAILKKTAAQMSDQLNGKMAEAAE